MNTPHKPYQLYKKIAEKTNTKTYNIKDHINTNRFPDNKKHKILYELAKAAQIPSHLLKQYTGFDIDKYEKSRKERKDWMQRLKVA